MLIKLTSKPRRHVKFSQFPVSVSVLKINTHFTLLYT